MSILPLCPRPFPMTHTTNIMKNQRASVNEWQRLVKSDWQQLVKEWIAVKHGATDKRYGGDHNLWTQHISNTVPLNIRDAALPLFAAEIGDPDVLNILYRALTPNSHVSYLLTTDLVPCQTTFDALLQFSDYFNISLTFSENAVLLRRALGSCDDTLFNRIPDLDQDSVFSSLVIDPGLLQHTGAAMAPLVAEYLSQWVQEKPKTLLSVFLVCAMEGLTKSVNAILAAGLNPFKALGVRDQNFMSPNRITLSRYRKAEGLRAWPESFLKVLDVLDTETTTSNHARLQIAELFAPGASVSILGSDPNTRIAGIAPEDWVNKNNSNTDTEDEYSD